MAETRRPKRKEMSATDAEKTRLDDEAVENTLNVEQEKATEGTKSVLPGPPIPPARQSEILARQKKRNGAPEEPDTRIRKRTEGGHRQMIASEEIKEHMEVVGSDGTHVGTVDRCEEQDRIKLTKSDPASGGKHRFIPLDWVGSVDRQVHLTRPGAEILRQLG